MVGIGGVGICVGSDVHEGNEVGIGEGKKLGDRVGMGLGMIVVGIMEGCSVGIGLGCAVVGIGLGSDDGLGVG